MSHRKSISMAVAILAFACGSGIAQSPGKYAGETLSSTELKLLQGALPVGNITDGTTLREFGQAGYSSGTANGSDGNFAIAASDLMFKTNWYFRVSAATSETRFAAPDSATLAGDTATLTYNSLGGGVFSAELTVVVDEPGAGIGTQYSTMEITNTSGSALSIDLFNYTDIDAAGTFGTDNATNVSAGGHIIMQVVDGASTVQVGGESASSFQVNEWGTGAAVLPQTLENGDVTNLNNSGLPFGPGDYTGTIQWSGLTIPVGGSVSVRHGIAVNTELVFGDLPQADVSIALSADPTPVDIGQTTTITAAVANAGPETASGVSAVVTLPEELQFQSSSPIDWTCSETDGVVSCDLSGDIASGASAPDLDIDAFVDAPEPITVTVDGSVNAAVDDPDTSDNADSVDVEITGDPLPPDCIFADGFEEGGDGSCGPAVNPDIVIVDDVNLVAEQTLAGSSIDWLTQKTCTCDTAPFNFNIWGATTMSFFWPTAPAGTNGGVSLDGGTTYAVLASGAEIGPSSQFITALSTASTANWRNAANVDGYIGFRFQNTDTGQINFGYARITTTGTTGHPATLVSYAYNSAGDPITIP